MSVGKGRALASLELDIIGLTLSGRALVAGAPEMTSES